MNKAWVSLGIAIASLAVGVGASRAENLEHVRKLLQTNNCKGCDLSNASLSGLDLRDANLTEANLEGADLSDTQLVRANLQKANLQNAKITNAIFTGANLKDATLAGAENIGLCQGNIFTGFGSGADQESTCLMMSLIGTFGPEELCKPDYSLQDLKMGDSFCSMIGDRNFAASSLITSSFKSFLKVTSFYGADLTNTNLQSVDLTSADLRYATLNNVNLDGVTLDYANLINASLQNVPEESLDNALVETSDVKKLIQNAIAKEVEEKRKSIGISTLGTLIRAQQAYRLENSRFADDINALAARMAEPSEYTYTIVSQPDPTQSVVITALSQAPDLKSYVAIASQTGDRFERLICETEKPSQSLPNFDFVANPNQCPTGMNASE